MSLQNAANVLAVIKRETVVGTAATASGATQMRIIDSPGLELKRALVQSAEKRDDGYKAPPRLGGKMVDGSFNSEGTVGGHTDMLIEAVARSTWATATSIGFATMTTVALGTNTVTAAGGSWFSQGIMVGDIFTIAGTTTSANNGLNTRVLAMGTLTLTVATNTFVTLAATATGTITVLKKLKSATTPTDYSHTIEQYDEDTDLTELFLGNTCTSMKMTLKPGQPVQMAYSFMGMDRTILTTGTSPWFTTPSLTTGTELIADDATLRYNGSVVTSFTGFDFMFSIAAKGENVIGSFVPPKIFTNDCTISASVTGLLSDFSDLALFDAETEFDLSVKLEELTTTTPKPCLSFFFARVKIISRSAPFGGSDGAKVQTLGLAIMPKVAATGYDGSPFTIHSSAP